MSHAVRRRRRAGVLFAAAAAAVASSAVSAAAATYTWSGASTTSSNWNVAANWSGNAAPPTAGSADLHFATSTRLTPNAEAAYALNSLTFNAGAAAFNLSGGPITLGAGGLADSATNAETIGAPVVAGANQTWSVAAAAGPLNLPGGLAVAPGAMLTLPSGALNCPGSLTIGNSTTASAVAGLVLSGATVTAGVVDVGGRGDVTAGVVTQSAGSLTTQNLIVGDATGAASAFNITGGTVTVTGYGLIVGGYGTGVVNQTGGSVTAGTLELGESSGAVATYNLSGGTLTLSVTPTNNQTGGTVNLNGGTLRAGASNVLLEPGEQNAYVLSGGAKIDTNGNAVTLYAPLQHGGTAAIDGGLTKLGAGTLTLAVANTYTGPTTLAGGTLVPQVSGSLSAGPIVFAGGVLNVSYGDYSPQFSAASTGDYSVTGSATLAASLGGTAGFALSGTGQVTLSAATQTYAGNTTVTGDSQLTIDGVHPTPSGAVLVDGPTPTLYHSMAFLTLSPTASNAAALNVPSITVGQAMIGLVYQTGGTVVAGRVVLGSGNGSSGEYDLPGGTLVTGSVAGGLGTGLFVLGDGTLRASASSANFVSVTAFNVSGYSSTVDTNGYNVTITSPVGGNSGADLTKAGAGTLTLAGRTTLSGGFYISGGILALSTAAALSPNLSVTVYNGASAVLVPHGVGPAIVPTVGSVYASSGLFDVSNEGLDLTSTTLAAVTAYAKAGYAGGTWAGTTGITSSAAAADPARLAAVGVIQNNQGGTALYSAATPFLGGVIPAASDALARETYYGDANLDGVVNGADYARIDAGFLSGGSLTGWFNGDFNYDGRVDASDYTLIDNAYNLQPAAATSPLATVTDEVAAVPEPAHLLLALAVAATVGTGRRRRV